MLTISDLCPENAPKLTFCLPVFLRVFTFCQPLPIFRLPDTHVSLCKKNTMKKLTTLTIVAIVAIFAFRSGVPAEQPQMGGNTNKTIISGNKTFHKGIVLNDGRISPGHSPGKITITGDFTLGNGATYKCELRDLTGAGIGHDQIDVSGNVTLGGVLNIVLDGYSPDNADMFEIIRYGGTLNGTFSAVSGMPTRWHIDYGLIAPGKVTIFGPNSTLPVALLNFDVKKIGRQAILTWQTTSEQNSDYFMVEHSTDAMTFSALERVRAQGESNAIHYYKVLDENPARGINYYRLKQVDSDGKFSYSNITSVTMDGGVISFYPNPATKTITFNMPVESVNIHDMRGKEVLRSQSPKSVIDISSLQPGIYIIDINQGQYNSQLIVTSN